MQSVCWRVCIVGSGPAGLAAAEVFSSHGHEVTIFERDDKPGGLLNVIPEWRFSHANITKMVAKLTQKGVKINLNTPILMPFSHDLIHNFDYILIATGTQKPRPLNCYNPVFAIDFLKNQNMKPKNVAIAGGGNTAVDCAVEAINRGGLATLYYRGDKAKMRASKAEIHRAEKHGVVFVFNSMPPMDDLHEMTIVAIGTDPEINQSESDKIHVIGDAHLGATDIASAMKHAKQVATAICRGHFSNSDVL